jgi:uncharacterized protein (DUF433 family)
MITTHYFKRDWHETTGTDLTGSWGHSVFYFETDTAFHPIRQLQVFENGKVLKYDVDYTEDQHGGLSEVALEDFEAYRIHKFEFEEIWQTSYYKQFPEIICTADTLWGQPRLDGRRLAVGDVVSLIYVNQDDINYVLNDFELSLQIVRQALLYCSSLQCKKDNPVKFCHNCILRVEQENEEIDKDNPEQPNWLHAGELLGKFFI